MVKYLHRAFIRNRIIIIMGLCTNIHWLNGSCYCESELSQVLDMYRIHFLSLYILCNAIYEDFEKDVRLNIANIGPNCRFCLAESGVCGITSGTPHPSVDNNSAVSSSIFPTRNEIFYRTRDEIFYRIECNLSSLLKKVPFIGMSN